MHLSSGCIKNMKKIILPILALLILLAAYNFFLSSPEIRNSSPTGENIICFGDSLTFGTGASKKMDYPSQLSRMISKPVINAGVPGDTTATAMNRLERDVLSESPRIVLITLGGNDLKNRIPRDLARKNLKSMIVSIQQQGALVIVGGISIPLLGRGFGEMYKEVCKETQALLIPNIYNGIISDKSLMNDPIHPNDKGYRLMAQKFHRAIEPYL